MTSPSQSSMKLAKLFLQYSAEKCESVESESQIIESARKINAILDRAVEELMKITLPNETVEELVRKLQANKQSPRITFWEEIHWHLSISTSGDAAMLFGSLAQL